MIRYLLVIMSVCLLSVYSCKNPPAGQNSGSAVDVGMPYMAMNRYRADIGEVSKDKNPSLTVDFQLSNIGDRPLVILAAEVSCSCLSVDYPKQPINTGETAVLKVVINTRSQEGNFYKTVTIRSNAENGAETIRIVGQILK